MLRNLYAWHADGSFVHRGNVGINLKQDAFRDAALHPVIIKHPNTGDQCVYVNCDFTVNFKNWTVEENTPLLSCIYAFITKPIFTTTVVWETGIVAIWDNRLVQHYATADYSGHTRLKHRIAVGGVPLEPI